MEATEFFLQQRQQDGSRDAVELPGKAGAARRRGGRRKRMRRMRRIMVEPE